MYLANRTSAKCKSLLAVLSFARNNYFYYLDTRLSIAAFKEHSREMAANPGMFNRIARNYNGLNVKSLNGNLIGVFIRYLHLPQTVKKQRGAGRSVRLIRADPFRPLPI